MRISSLKISLYILLFALVCLALAAFFAMEYFSARRDFQRMQNNLAASQQELEYYQTQNGLLAARHDALQLHYQELRQLYPEIIHELENLNIKAPRVESYSETVITQEKHIVTQLRDSLLYDTVPVKVFRYRDAYYMVDGMAVRDTQHVSIQSTDSLIQVVYRGERYKPWLWIFSRRKLQQVIHSKNPNSKILYSRQIVITR